MAMEKHMLKIASWNVNSIHVRLDAVLAWLDTSGTDILALQETKVPDERFPTAAFLDRGYYVRFSGQSAYNGVALISKKPITDVEVDIDTMGDPARRFLAATIAGLRVINLYVPNGAAVGTDKYAYKLDWLAAVTQHIQEALRQYPRLVVLGDFNIAPEDSDVHDPARWAGSVLVSEPERDAFQSLLGLGLVDSFRLFDQPTNAYSWWDYRKAGFQRNHGLRIDLILLSRALKGACKESKIDIEPRKQQRPSDHAPVWVTLEQDEF